MFRNVGWGQSKMGQLIAAGQEKLRLLFFSVLAMNFSCHIP